MQLKDLQFVFPFNQNVCVLDSDHSVIYQGDWLHHTSNLETEIIEMWSSNGSLIYILTNFNTLHDEY